MDHHEKLRLRAERQKAIDAVVQKCQDGNCPACRESEWEDRGVLALAPHNSPLDEVAVDRGPPVVVVRCKNCGCILLFDAQAVGANLKP
jgi:hypothetical protein